MISRDIKETSQSCDVAGFEADPRMGLFYAERFQSLGQSIYIFIVGVVIKANRSFTLRKLIIYVGFMCFYVYLLAFILTFF